MISVKENSGTQPRCPHCGEEIHTINSHRVISTFGKRWIYSCTSCNRSLGVSHRKGFWMG